jgi:anti-sigma28 factor (negative regulator of flagellin synthesis)
VSDARPDDRDPIPELEELDEAYSADYLYECADDEAREERLAELKRRIEHKAYRVDSDRIAEEMLERGLLKES